MKDESLDNSMVVASGVAELLPGDPNSQVVVPIFGNSTDGGAQDTVELAPRFQGQACCLGQDRCNELLFDDCSFIGGAAHGTGTICSETVCPGSAPIPTMSQWGVIVLFLVIPCTGTIQFGRRRSMS